VTLTRQPRVLVACEFSGVVRDAFAAAGCDATSCDLLPSERPGRYWILWEAEWEQRAPVDPLLLRRIHGGLFAVVAQWALSPVERVVLEAMAEGGAP
jgi:hypothetical protein